MRGKSAAKKAVALLAAVALVVSMTPLAWADEPDPAALPESADGSQIVLSDPAIAPDAVTDAADAAADAAPEGAAGEESEGLPGVQSGSDAADQAILDADDPAMYRALGAVGFYKWYGGGLDETVEEYAEDPSYYTTIGAPGDGTSLESLQTVAAAVNRINELRATQNLPALTISLPLLCETQCRVNYGAVVGTHMPLDYSIAEGENLAWVGATNPQGALASANAWWSEKSTWEKAIEAHPEYASMTARQLYNANQDLYNTVGHYLNLINTEYNVVGFAMNSNREQDKYYNTYAACFCKTRYAGLTVAEFEQLLDEYLEFIGEIGDPSNYDLSSISFSDAKIPYDGKAHSIAVSGALPYGVSVSYENNSATNVGDYEVTAVFTGKGVSEPLATKTATLTITPQALKSANMKLSATSFVWTGEVAKPAVTVRNAAGAKLGTSSRTIAFYNSAGKKVTSPTSVGTYTVKATGKGNYTGTVTRTFKIKPPGTTISKVTAASKGFTVKWAKKTTQVTGYQIRYSTSSKMTTTNSKLVTISKNSTVSKKVTKLKAKKAYYVQVRTYKVVGGTKYYSTWSAVKKVVTLK